MFTMEEYNLLVYAIERAISRANSEVKFYKSRTSKIRLQALHDLFTKVEKEIKISS